MNNIKNDILTVELFVTNRPDMASYDNNVIQSAIFQTANFLNARCNGMISKVWYVTDINSDLFRNEDEKEFILEAFITQTQYSLNMGNDFSVGSESLSMGSLSGSFQRPVERKEVAPGVDTLLQAGRVFFFQEFSLLNNECKTNSFNGELNDYLTYNIGDARYLAKNQPNALLGSVATIGENNFVTFADPKTIEFNTLNSQRIWDTYQNEYVDIHNVESLSFYGNNLYGFASGVERGEIYSLLAFTTMNWRADLQYKKDTIIQYAYESIDNKWIVEDFLALRDNTNANPINSPLDWRTLGTIPLDLTNIVNLVYTRVVAKYDVDFNTFTTLITDKQNTYEAITTKKYNDFETDIKTNVIPTNVESEVTTQLNALPTIEYETIIFQAGLFYYFNGVTDFNKYKDKYSMVESVDYHVVASGRVLSTSTTANESMLVGSSYIKDKYLSTSQFFLQSISNSGSRGALLFHKSGGGNTLGKYPIVSGFWDLSPTSTQERYFIRLNDTGYQEPFIPYGNTSYIVLIIRDIKVTKQGAIKQVLSTNWGSIVGDINNQTDLVDNFASLNKPNDFGILTTALVDRGTMNFSNKLKNSIGRISWEDSNVSTLTTNDQFSIEAIGKNATKAILNLSSSSNQVSFLSNRLVNVGAPTDNTDATNKLYVDNSLTPIKTDITTLRTDLGDLGNIVNTNTQAITTDKALIVANTTAIATNVTNITANTANITKLTTTVDKTYDLNVEFDTGQKFGTKIIYSMLVAKGNLKNQTETIPNTGTLVNDVDLFLGVEWGVIARAGSPQIHNINAVTNLPNEHASIIFQDINTNSIKYWFNQTMTLTSFKNRPFQALIKYTKR